MAMTFDTVVSRLAQLTAAADELSRALPTGAQFLAQVGKAYTMLGAHERAEPFLRRASDANPTDPFAQYNLGAALVFMGRLDEAKRRMAEAARLFPRHHMAWYTLADMEKQTHAQNYIPQLEKLYADGPDPEGNRTLHAGHALAKTYEDLGDYETAFDWLLKAKAIRKTRAAYSAESEDALFAAAAETYKAGRGEGFPSAAPIFVCGMPRSGTTLVEAILAAHPDVTSCGEVAIMPALVKHISGGGARHILDPANLRDTADIDLAKLGRGYIEATAPVAGETPHFIDKTPLDYLYAGLIHRALPQARIICIRRDPMDSVAAFFRTMFVATPHVYPSVYDLETAAHHYVRFHKLADHWREVLPADRYREQSYEALVDDQEGQTRELLAFVGLDFDPVTLNFHDQPMVVSSASAVQVRRPVYRSSLGRWKRYGDRMKPAVDILRKAGIEVDAA